jgi:Gluconate 2-dehydrogenase subunit 3
VNLSAEQTATLAALLDRLIPDDELGPGALACGALEHVAASLEADACAALDRAAGFAALDPAAQDAFLAAAERDGDAFLELVRTRAIERTFSVPAGWALLSYPGPRPHWSEHDQRIEES